MSNVVLLRHQNEMQYSKEFFLLTVPKEIYMLIALVTFLCAASLFILIFGKTDETIHSSGIVRPQENVSSINNVIAGQIVELDYFPGQYVTKGNVLYRIDPRIYEARNSTLSSEAEDLHTKIAGIESLIESYIHKENRVPKEYTAAYTRFENYLSQRKMLSIKLEIATQAFEEELLAPEFSRVESSVKNTRNEKRLAETNINSLDAQFIAALYEEYNELILQQKTNQQNILELKSSYEFLEIRAPVDGFVQEVSSLNKGDYIGSNEHVLNIIPDDSKSYRVEMHISPRDIGKITTGLNVKYRLSAFPFFEYRGATGTITAIDPDIRSGNNALYYCVYANIDRTVFSNRRGDSFPIRAGLETDARIVLGTNTILHTVLKKMDLLY